MKKIVLLLTLLFAAYVGVCQENEIPRIAVFDPASSGTSIDEGTKVAVREIISSTIVNTGKYSIVERSLLEKVMEEQKFSNSGAVDDMQATEIGKLAGANKVVLSVVTLTGGRNMLSVKIIDVMTATVERQKVKVVTSGELLNVVEPLTLEMLNMERSNASNVVSVAANNYREPVQPQINNNVTANQNPGNFDSSAEVIMYGVDYSRVQIVGTNSTPQELANTFAEVNATFGAEPNRFNFTKLSGRPTALYTEPTNALINTINWQESLSGYGKEPKFSFEDAIMKYKLPHTHGMGMVLIALIINNHKSYCRHELVYFDINTRKILFRQKIDTKAKGVSLRNALANSVFEIIDNDRLRLKIKIMSVVKKKF